MSVLKLIGSGDFNEGLQTYKKPHLIDDGASPFMKNVDLFRIYNGVIAKRKGTIKIAQLGDSGTTPSPSFKDISGLYQFRRSDGVHFLYASENETVFQVDGVKGSTIPTSERWTSVFSFGGSGTGTGTGGLDGSNTEFDTLQDLCVMVNKHIATQKNAGGTSDGGIINPFTPLLGTPPANANYITSHKGRMFIANTSAGKSRLHWSAAGNPNDWVTVNDAGFVDVNIDDGDVITSIKSCGEDLFIFKRFSCWVLSGYNPTNFTLTAKPTAAGCIAHRTVQNQGAFLVYLSDQGVHAINSYGLASLLTATVRIDVESLTATVKQGACSGIWNRRQYWLAYDSNGDGVNDSAYILNLEDEAWTLYDNINVNVFVVLDDYSLISGGSDNVKLRQHNVGDSDEGAIINMEWRSKEYDFGDVFSYKKLQNLMMYFKRLDGHNITVNVITDGIDQIDTQSIPLDQTLGAAQENVHAFLKSLPQEQGRTIQFVFKNSEANAPVEIYAFTAEAEIISRQFST